MTFSRIGDGVGRRRATIEVLRRTTRGVVQITKAFLEELYGGAVARQCVVTYTQDTVTIRAATKRISDDLVLRSGELSAVVRAEKFPLKQIVIS